MRVLTRKARGFSRFLAGLFTAPVACSASTIAIALTALGACSGGGGTSDAVNNVSSNQHFIYVDGAGACKGRTPCYTNLLDATIDSFRTQFNSQVQPIRPNEPPDQIVVMPGIYTAGTPGDWILILGFAAEFQRTSGIWKLAILAEQGPDKTTISGQNTGPCITVMDQIDLHIRGFTFAGCADPEPFLTAGDYSIYLQSFTRANIKIEGNVFRDNTSSSGTIGVSPYFVNVSELDVKIIGNRFFNNLGSISIYGLPSTVRPEYSAAVLIANNLMYDNGRSNSPNYSVGGIRVFNFIESQQSIKVEIVGNTIAGNRDVGLSVVQANVIVENNIVYGNPIDIDARSSYAPVNHNLVGETSRLLSTTSNIIADPLFTNQSAGDFSLTPGSPAIDAGVALSIPELAFDLNGEARPVDGNADGVAVPDIGAIEFR
ncbi:MAG: hypothetical protein E6H49_04700 [Betaproteobacteria bacterium]|nr:MAG: hypothetical protein E6H49_04700 [Betaproteobacteria bacterium]